MEAYSVLLSGTERLACRQRRTPAALSQKAGLLAALGDSRARRASVRAVSDTGKLWTPDGGPNPASEVQQSQSKPTPVAHLCHSSATITPPHLALRRLSTNFTSTLYILTCLRGAIWK